MGYKILVTGTPGVGKSTLSEFMRKALGFRLVGLSDLIEKKRLYSNRCTVYDTLEYSQKKVEKYLKKWLKPAKSYIIDTHDPECVSFMAFDAIVVLSADPSVLRERYKKRGYNEKKTDENIQVEIMEVVYNEVVDSICQDDEEVARIIRVDTAKNKQLKTVEEIYKEVTESPQWKASIQKSVHSDSL